MVVAPKEYDRRVAVVRRFLSGLVKLGLRGAAIRALSAAYYLYFRGKVNLKVVGLNNLPKPPFVVVGNHSSAADAYLALAILAGRLGLRPYFVVHERAFRRDTLERAFLEFLEARPRSGSGQQVVEVMANWLRDGKVVVLPPEGMFNRGRIMKGYTGIVRLYHAVNPPGSPPRVPVVPACTIGADKAFSPWPDADGRYRFHKVGVVVRVGKPIYWAPRQPGELTREYLREKVDWLMDHVARLALQKGGAVESWKLAGLEPGRPRRYGA
ncbi:MAG: hypothetical protein Kow0069_23780 [Promethearchaeota archaeon]